MKSFAWLIVFILLTGCGRTYQDFAIYEGDYSNGDYSEIAFRHSIETDNFDFDMTYIGPGSRYFIFECNFVNEGADTVVLRRRDFSMDVVEGKVLKPYDPDLLISELEDDERELRKVKKRRTLWNAVLTGLEFVVAASQGAPLAENLLFSAEPIAYIFDDRSFIQRNIETVEDEMAYIHEMALETSVVLPYSEVTVDLLFPFQQVNSNVYIIYTRDREEYQVSFEEEVFR